MSSLHLLDPELLSLAEQSRPDTLSLETVGRMRQQQRRAATLQDPSATGVERSEIHAAGTVRCLMYRPPTRQPVHGAYLHLHGGGYIVGSPDAADATNLALCSTLSIIVLSVDYRLAPEHSAPHALADAYASLAWLHDNAGDLAFDSKRIAIGGESAGGGLAAALALHARDRGEIPIAHQHLTYPMLDSRTGSTAHPGDPLTGEFGWSRAYNQFAWNSYLGDCRPEAPYVPALASDLSRLPSTWMVTGALDLFRDENVSYARRLLESGGPVDFAVYAGACHGFRAVQTSSLAQRYQREHREALRRVFT